MARALRLGDVPLEEHLHERLVIDLPRFVAEEVLPQDSYQQIPRLLLHVSIYHVSIYLRAHGTGMMWNPHCIDLLEPSTPDDYEEEVTVVTHEYTIYNSCTAAHIHCQAVSHVDRLITLLTWHDALAAWQVLHVCMYMHLI